MNTIKIEKRVQFGEVYYYPLNDEGKEMLKLMPHRKAFTPKDLERLEKMFNVEIEERK